MDRTDSITDGSLDMGADTLCVLIDTSMFLISFTGIEDPENINTCFGSMLNEFDNNIIRIVPVFLQGSDREGAFGVVFSLWIS